VGGPVGQPTPALTPRLTAALAIARYEADVHGRCPPHGGHLLIALAWERAGIAGQVLAGLGVAVDDAGPAGAPLAAVMAAAVGEAQGRGHDYIGTEHALLALAAVDRPQLERHGVADQVRAAVERAIGA
jgi:hypothetical protein